MSVETQDELCAIAAAGRVVAQTIRAMRRTVEPLVAAGGPAVRIGPEGWTISTADGSVSAHAEHTIVIQGGRPLVPTA